jgi:hypothetical protein
MLRDRKILITNENDNFRLGRGAFEAKLKRIGSIYYDHDWI